VSDQEILDAIDAGDAAAADPAASAEDVPYTGLLARAWFTAFNLARAVQREQNQPEEAAS